MTAAVPGGEADPMGVAVPSSAAAPLARRRRALAAWAASWAVLLALTFVGVTALTLALWLTDPGYAETTPVGDLAFFALGAAITLGFAVQVRHPERHVAGVHQALVGSLCLALAGVVGARVEPAVGGFVLLVAALVLLALHPRRGVARPTVAGLSRPLAGLAVLGLVPAVGFAGALLGMARDAGPSCFAGQCARGDRFAEAAAAAVAIALLAAVAAGRARGWRLLVWVAGVGALVIGAASLAVPDAAEAPSGVWAAVAVLWGIAVVIVGEREARRTPRGR